MIPASPSSTTAAMSTFRDVDIPPASSSNADTSTISPGGMSSGNGAASGNGAVAGAAGIDQGTVGAGEDAEAMRAEVGAPRAGTSAR